MIFGAIKKRRYLENKEDEELKGICSKSHENTKNKVAGVRC